MKQIGKAIQGNAFFTYSWVGALFTVLNIVLVWVFIDILRVPTILSSTIVVGGLFVGKYFVYKWSGFVSSSHKRTDDESPRCKCGAIEEQSRSQAPV